MSTEQLSLRAVARPFAEAFSVKRGLLDLPGMSRRQQSRVKESLSDDLKKLCDVSPKACAHPR
jgi:hypothetical protein